MKSLFSVKSSFDRTYKSLMGAWDQTRESWAGASRDKFESKHIRQIHQASNELSRSMAKLADEVDRILRQMP